MTDGNQSPHTTNTKLKLFLLGYSVRENDNSDKAYWSKVGIA